MNLPTTLIDKNSLPLYKSFVNEKQALPRLWTKLVTALISVCTKWYYIVSHQIQWYSQIFHCWKNEKSYHIIRKAGFPNKRVSNEAPHSEQIHVDVTKGRKRKNAMKEKAIWENTTNKIQGLWGRGGEKKSNYNNRIGNKITMRLYLDDVWIIMHGSNETEGDINLRSINVYILQTASKVGK